MAERAAGFRPLPDSPPKGWRFYGREAETLQLRAAFLAPEFDLVAIRGSRCVGKSRLLHEVVRGLPEDRPVVWHSVFSCNTPEKARDNLLYSLNDRSVSGASGKEVSRLRDAAASLQSMPEILEYLLRGGVSVAVDWADRMQHDALSGLVQEIGDLARKLRREDAAIAGATGPLLARRGTLVLLGTAHIRMRELLDALGPSAVGRSILLEPWNGATLVTVARDRGWLEYPRRLALVRTALGGLPLDWERFAETPAADFAAWPDDGEWRLEFARYLIEEVIPDQEQKTWVMVRSEDPPEDWRILEYLARDEEKEIDTGAIHAAFRDVPPDRLDAWLAVMSEDLGLIEEVPAAPRATRQFVRMAAVTPPRESLPRTAIRGGQSLSFRGQGRPALEDLRPPAALLGRRTPGNRRGNTGAIRQFLRALHRKAGGPAAVPGGRRPRAAEARMRPGLAVCADRGSRGTGPPALPENRPGRAARFRVRRGGARCPGGHADPLWRPDVHRRRLRRDLRARFRAGERPAGECPP